MQGSHPGRRRVRHPFVGLGALQALREGEQGVNVTTRFVQWTVRSRGRTPEISYSHVVTEGATMTLCKKMIPETAYTPKTGGRVCKVCALVVQSHPTLAASP